MSRLATRVAAEHRAARDRERVEAVDRAVVAVVGQRHRDAEAAEHDRLGEDPAHQELLVAAAVRDVDRAAEDEREQQHEHDRLDRRVGQLLRLAAHVLDPAPRDHERVGDGGGSGAAARGRGVGHQAASCSRSGAGGAGLGGGAGEREEDVVERRLPQPEVLDRDARRRRARPRARRPPPAPPSENAATERSATSTDGCEPATRSMIARHLVEILRRARRSTWSWSPPNSRFRRRASPRAITWP